MSVRVRVSLAAPFGARLRQIAGAGLLLVSAASALAGCTAGSVLAPVPAVDVGTHTAAIVDPRPSRLTTAAAAAEMPSSGGQGEPEMVWQTGPAGIGDAGGQEVTFTQSGESPDTDAGYPQPASSSVRVPEIAEPQPIQPEPIQPNYQVPSPSRANAMPPASGPADGPRYAMLPPARPGDVEPSRTFTPPAPKQEDIPEAVPQPSPPRSPPAARDLPRPDVMPTDEVALRRELKRLGVRYVDLPPIHEHRVCGIDYPVKVLGLSGGIQLKAPAVLNARMAVTFAEYVKKDFAPAVRMRYFSGIRTIYTGSTYACRNMIGESTNHLSEHAKGNAIDVMKIKLDSGRVIDVTKPGFFAFRQRGFLNRVRAEACDYFTTVLGPGYNRAHANHFHFDLKRRRNGYVACR
jgi:hypothetical protein